MKIELTENEMNRVLSALGYYANAMGNEALSRLDIDSVSFLWALYKDSMRLIHKIENQK